MGRPAAKYGATPQPPRWVKTSYRAMSAVGLPETPEPPRTALAVVADSEQRRRPVAGPDRDELLLATLGAVAPGTPLRDGLERILRGNTGALIVLGHNRLVESLCTGGFVLDVDFSSTRLRELAKMDGALVLSDDLTKIVRAAVHLVPDPTISTEESGTRHRTAERVAKQTGYPVISVSQSMQIIALYVDSRRHVLDQGAAILSRANQALATLERYKLRLDEVAGALSALEVEDLVTVRDVVAVSQRIEMVRRIAREIEGYVVELGADGRLMNLQLEELMAGVEVDRELVVRDYVPTGRKARSVEEILADLDRLSPEDMLDLTALARVIGFASGVEAMEAPVSPRGYRLLAKVPRLPRLVVDRLVEHFASLQKLLAANVDDLKVVEGVGETRAKTVREGLSRLAESSILERYV
jgi:diadenylate cyclase